MNRRELLPAIGTGAALGFLATLVGTTNGCAPTPVLAAEAVSPAIAAVIERHRIALAAQHAAGCAQSDRERVTIDRPEDAAAAAAYDVAEAAFDDACGHEQEAHNAVLRAPILTLADMRTKAAYLASVSGHMIHDGSTMAMLLASMASVSTEASELTLEPDPLLALDQAYRKGLADFNADDAATNEECAEQAARTYRPHYDRLCTDPPQATTIAGALAGIRLVLWEEETCGHHEGFTTNTLRAALAYFDGRA